MNAPSRLSVSMHNGQREICVRAKVRDEMATHGVALHTFPFTPSTSAPPACVHASKEPRKLRMRARAGGVALVSGCVDAVSGCDGNVFAFCSVELDSKD